MVDDPVIHAATVVPPMVSSGGGLDMHVQPTEIVGREGVFRVTLLNQMSRPVYVVLAARDCEAGLRFRIQPKDAVIVPAGGVAGPIMVRVAPKVRTLIGEPHPYEITFDGRTPWSEDASTPALVQRAHFTYVPRVTVALVPLWLRGAPHWAVLLPLVLLLLLLVFAGGRTLASPPTRVAITPPVPTRVAPAVQPPQPRAATQGRVLPPSIPSIRRFALVHPRQGRPYELVWQTSNATSVMLDGRPVAARGAMTLHAPLHSAMYWLVALHDAHRATAGLRVVVDARTTDPRAVVLTTPDIATFAVRRRHGRLHAIWLVRNAIRVQLQGRPVDSAGDRPAPMGVSTLRLTAANDVGSRQRVFRVVRAAPTATPRPRPTATPTLRPTDTPIPPPTVTSTPPPTSTPLPPPTATSIPRPPMTPTPVFVTIGTRPAPVGVVATPTAVSITCCLAQP